jgi:hypothetical protein
VATPASRPARGGRLGPDRFGERRAQPRAGLPPQDVRDFLTEQAELGFAGDENDRRGAMFQALAASDWYCSGGYLTLAAVGPNP